MALRNQPYLPLYVDDYLTDEKLNMCSAATQGIYIKILCILHKSEEYGKLLIKAKYKQNESKIKNFALQLSKLITFSEAEIEAALTELIDEGVMAIEDDVLYQKRMVRDNDISIKRGLAGAKGGKSSKYTPQKRLYNEPGFLYIVQDLNAKNVFKIGISKSPQKRLDLLQSKTNKNLEIVYLEECENMGLLEDAVLQELNNNRDGKWIYNLELNDIINIIQKQNKSKIEANTVAKQVANSGNGNGNGNVIVYVNESNTIKYSEDFENFWQAYPKKVGKGGAYRVWRKLKPNKELQMQILDAVERQKKSEQWKRDGGQYIPNPQTWLNQARWDDEISETRSASYGID